MNRRQIVMLLLLSSIWGGSFMLIKLGVTELEPAVVVLGRLVVGALVLIPLAVGGLAALRGRFGALLLLGLLNNALPFWLLGFAETRIDSGLAGVIQASAPLLTVLLATRIDASQRVRGERLAGFGIGFLGVALLLGVQSGGEIVAALAVVATAGCYAVSVLYAGRALAGVPPVQLSLGQLAAAAVLVAPVGIYQLPDDRPGWGVVAAIVALGALGTGLAYILYFGLIQSAGASRAILVTYLVPAFALAYGAVFLDEAITAVALGGLALVLAGVALATGVLRRPSTVTA
jgi:drug/metabolite transporter (DMT)-like permease